MALMNLRSVLQLKNNCIYWGGSILRPNNILGVMKTRLSPSLNRHAIFLAFVFILNACTPSSTPTFFIPPTELPQINPVTAPVVTAAPTTVPTVLIPTPTPTPTCTNNLTYIQDLTIPDGTTVSSGQSIDKQWLVSNSGTCNWDSRYRLKLISGDAMAAPVEQALYPARAGAQVKLRILFTAPQDAGTYQSAWQAVAPDGTAFGTLVNIQITVGP
jgi:Ig-like domain from next to BRCA1 gene